MPLPPGDIDLHPAGPEEVSVVRHADPVQVRPAGALSGHPVEFYDRRTRLTAGGSVIVAAGGRAEILWPGGSSIVMLGRGIGWVGSPSRGEPTFEFAEVERARLDLREGDSVRLVGGALLTGASGPYLLEHRPDRTLFVQNQSKGTLSIAFREELFELAPGQIVILPLLSSGGAPFSDDPDVQRFSGPGFAVRMIGRLEAEEEAGGIRVRASADSSEGAEARAFGLRVRLTPGESVLFRALRGSPAAEAQAAPQASDP